MMNLARYKWSLTPCNLAVLQDEVQQVYLLFHQTVKWSQVSCFHVQMIRGNGTQKQSQRYSSRLRTVQASNEQPYLSGMKYRRQ